MYFLSAPLFFSVLLAAAVSVSCGGSSSTSVDNSSGMSGTPSAPNTTISEAIKLKSPLLLSNNTGSSVSVGATRTCLWNVDSAGIDWEFSLDMGQTWTRGEGTSFEVKVYETKTIWVRAGDSAGKKSDIVTVNCVLDTVAPSVPGIAPRLEDATNRLQLSGLESGARWEYALNTPTIWHLGSGPALGVLGNGITQIWLRQVSVAGNPSEAQAFNLQSSTMFVHESSGIPLQPSVLAPGFSTYLIHGVVMRGDADYVRWDVPKGQLLMSVKLMLYESDDQVAFYALQPNGVFDAGTDTNRMLSFDHMGPSDLNRNVLANTAPQLRGEGPMTLWFQQLGISPTKYAIEVVLAPVN